MANTALSVILPVYNVAPYLVPCLDSIEKQAFRDWEAILVDDGSTDISGIICDSYARHDPRFRVIHQGNRGVSAARNTGIMATSAPLLTFIDPDDIISEDYFGELVRGIDKIGADLAVALFQFMQEDGTISQEYAFLNTWERKNRNFSDQTIIGNKAVAKAVAHNNFSCVSWGKVYTRELWGNTRFPEEIDLGEDMSIIPGLIIKAEKAIYCPGSAYYYRIREKSLLHGTVVEERYRKDIAASSVMFDQLVEHSPELEKEFRLLKYQYDFGCYRMWLTTDQKKKRSQSWLYGILESIADSRGCSITDAPRELRSSLKYILGTLNE